MSAKLRASDLDAAIPATILVVDDEPDVEALIKRRFRKRISAGELDFVFASNGEQALELVTEAENIGIVLCDINMPAMDGLTLLAKLGELERELATVMVSAYGDLKNIRTAMNRGAFDFVTKPIDFDDLASTLEKTERHIRALRETRRTRAQLDSLHKELEVARKIQSSILPDRFPSSRHFEVFGRMLPVRAVGGDFFDVFELEDDSLVLLIADVSGKGIPAAIYMGVVHTMLMTAALTEPDPGACLERVNGLLCRNLSSGMLVSVFMAHYEPEAGRFSYANGGHNPPVVVSAGSCECLWAGRGVMLGVDDAQAYPLSERYLEPGEGVFMYTDGITEAMDENRNEYTEERLLELLDNASALAPAALTERVVESVRAHARATEQSDDLTCLVLRRLELDH